MHESEKSLPPALALLSSERPRNINWLQASGLLFGDWGTSRLYVLGLAFLVAGRTSFYLIAAMSLLILAVGWAYTQICRIYPDGGGVYSAARQRNKLLGVVGALLLFADYTVTASLSALDAFHYFGLGHQHVAAQDGSDAGDQIVLDHGSGIGERLEALPAGITLPAGLVKYDSAAKALVLEGELDSAERDRLLAVSSDKSYRDAVEALYLRSQPEPLFALDSPGLWAIVAIIIVGGLNLLGPKHSSGFAVIAALAMVAITLLVVGFALPQVKWGELKLGTLNHPPRQTWQAFVAIVLALSGVEAIANLTGVMKKPVYVTSKKSIWLVACEVALFNMLLVVVMMAIFPLSREGHKEDMMAYLAGHYIGAWGEWPVRIIGGTLLLSATNTAVNGLMSIVYVMSRDNELPAALQKLNGFGAPWIGAIIAAGVPAIVLLFAHDLETLSHLYAIGIVGAVAINCCLCAFHPRLRQWWRKWPMGLLGVFLIVIWVTLAMTKLHALIFVSVVMAVGLSLRYFTRLHANSRQRPSLLRRAIMEQLTPEALAKPRMLLSTAGSTQLAEVGMKEAADRGAALVVTFVREVALNFMVGAEKRLTLDNDPAAQALFTDFLELGHRYGVPVIPMYDTGTSSAELIAELAAINGVEKVMIGTSRRGALHHLIKGSFQKRLEHLLPPEIPVQVISAPDPAQQSPPPMPEAQASDTPLGP